MAHFVSTPSPAAGGDIGGIHALGGGGSPRIGPPGSKAATNFQAGAHAGGPQRWPQLPHGRGFLLHRCGQNLDLRGGPLLIGWITPGNRRCAQLKVKTRVGAASIQGTTLFIDDRGNECFP